MCTFFGLGFSNKATTNHYITCMSFSFYPFSDRFRGVRVFSTFLSFQCHFSSCYYGLLMSEGALRADSCQFDAVGVPFLIHKTLLEKAHMQSNIYK